MLARISQLPDVQVKAMEAQKYLGGLVTKNLQWNSQVLAACSKAKRTLGFLRRLTFDTHDQRARKLLYLSLVRSNLAYCSQVWAPQAVNLILDIERIQRRAAKFILSLPHRSEVSYKQRLLKIGLLPLCYWHESSFSHPNVFKTIPLVSFRRLVTSRKFAIRGPPVSDQCYQTNRQQCSMVCTVIDNSSRPIHGREIAQSM